jgi:hypothetical protein
LTVSENERVHSLLESYATGFLVGDDSFNPIHQMTGWEKLRQGISGTFLPVRFDLAPDLVRHDPAAEPWRRCVSVVVLNFDF